MADHDDDFELVRGSGNVFADFDVPDANLRQFRAILAAEIVKTLDSEGLTVRDAEARTGIAAADFSRIRQVNFDRFTIDRLMRILDQLNRDVRVKISVAPRVRPSKRGRWHRRLRREFQGSSTGDKRRACGTFWLLEWLSRFAELHDPLELGR